MIILIAAITMDGFIARHSNEIINWSADLSLFKKQTLGQTVIMGFNTANTMAVELEGRTSITVHRNDEPIHIIKNVKTEKCFIIGGGKTNARFAPLLTHVYLTTHPFIFGKGVPLFDGEVDELKLELEHTIPVEKKRGIFQFQYKVVND